MVPFSGVLHSESHCDKWCSKTLIQRSPFLLNLPSFTLNAPRNGLHDVISRYITTAKRWRCLRVYLTQKFSLSENHLQSRQGIIRPVDIVLLFKQGFIKYIFKEELLR